MAHYLLITLITCLFFFRVAGQPSDGHDVFFENDSIIVYDYADTQDGYYLFVPKQIHTGEKLPVTVFVHGYGALNPMIYGKWLKHIVRQKHVLIYPRYQEKLLVPAPPEFVPNTVKAIRDAFKILQTLQINADTSKLHLVGHSYGGVIAANLAARYDSLNIPGPAIAFICEPGTGPFRGGILEDYSNMPKETLVTIIVGMQDGTVGQKFGEYLFEKTAHLDERALIYQYPSDSLDITASHYEPYALDTLLDNGHRNFTSTKSLRVSRYDAVDTLIYWPVFDLMASAAKEGEPQSIRNILWPMIYGLGSAPADRAILDVKYDF